MTKHDKNLIENVNNESTSSITKNDKVLRKCIACGKILQRNQLIKITKCHKTNEIIIFPDTKQFGRSSYICYNRDCLKLVIKKKKLQRTLKIQLLDTDIKKLESVLN